MQSSTRLPAAGAPDWLLPRAVRGYLYLDLFTPHLRLREIPAAGQSQLRDAKNNARSTSDSGCIKNPPRSLARRHKAFKPRSAAETARPCRGLCDPGKNRELLGRKTVRMEDRGDQ